MTLVYPTIYRGLYTSGGAGIPSTNKNEVFNTPCPPKYRGSPPLPTSHTKSMDSYSLMALSSCNLTNHYCKIGNPTCNPLFLLINWINHLFLKLVCLNHNADASAKPYLHSCHENDTRCNDGKRFQLHKSPLGLPGELAFSCDVAACSPRCITSIGQWAKLFTYTNSLYGHPEKDAHPKRQKVIIFELRSNSKKANRSQKKKKTHLSSADICEAQGFFS